METKVCHKCGVEKELCLENFYWQRCRGCWYSMCKTCKKKWDKQHNREYYARNREVELHRTRNKPKDAVARYERNRRKKPGNRIRANISRSISFYASKSAGSKRGLSHLKFVDWNYKELLAHLESLFESWMTWDNYGRYDINAWDDNDPSTWTWQVDHIKPHSEFRYSSMDCQEFRDCWALENLRPYSSKQNNLDRNRKGLQELGKGNNKS